MKNKFSIAIDYIKKVNNSLTKKFWLMNKIKNKISLKNKKYQWLKIKLLKTKLKEML